MKEKLIVWKEHIFAKRIQDAAYNYQKDSLTVDGFLFHVDFAENFAIRAFLFLLYAAIIKMTKTSCSKKLSSLQLKTPTTTESYQ